LAVLPETDAVLASDRKRLEDVRSERAKSAAAFFANVANDRDQLGDEYLPQTDIEASMRSLIGDSDYDYMVDLGTGTGRILEVFSDRIRRGSGIDNNTDMLKVARSNLAHAHHAHISVRQGDLHATPLEEGVADLVAISEAARIMIAGGVLLVVDFEAHKFDDFRDRYAHRRLGFSDSDIGQWCVDAGLTLVTTEIVKTPKDRPDVKIWLGKKNNEARRVSWDRR